MNPTVIAVPCLRDNYAYVVHAPDSKEAIVIDPSEAAPVAAALSQHGLQLAAILNTHHHWDHVGGNETLCQHADLPVFAHRSDAERARVPKQTHRLEDGQYTSVLSGRSAKTSLSDRCIISGLPSKRRPQPEAKRVSPVKTAFPMR